MSARRRLATFTLAALLLAPTFARAQDHEGAGPTPDDIKKKVVEIERLMKGAEESLARSTDTRSAAEKAAEAARKILDDKAKQETGKSAEDLRKEAEAGSKDAKEALERLTKAANEEAQKAAAEIQKMLDAGGTGSGAAGRGVKELIEKVKGEGQGASAGIKWLLEKAVKQGGGSGGGGQDKSPKQKQENAGDPKKPEDKKDPEKPQDTKKPPDAKSEPPRSPEYEQWIAELPPQVRKAYETQDWDSIPPKWRELLKQWTKKMADDLEKERP